MSRSYRINAYCPFGHLTMLVITFQENPTMVGFEPKDCETCKNLAALKHEEPSRFRRWREERRFRRKFDKELKEFLDNDRSEGGRSPQGEDEP